jgi:hypothetical protein
MAIAPQDNWGMSQTKNYFKVTKALSDVTGNPLSGHVRQGKSLPIYGPMGQVFIKGDCEALYVSDGEGIDILNLEHVWRPVEFAPQEVLCRSVIPPR